MTAIPTTATAEKLLKASGYPLISLYMPTHRAGSDIWQDPIRFKNLLRSAEHDLEAGGTPRGEIESLLKPLEALRENREFWQYQADGLALFRSSTAMEEFRLATPVPELCVVGAEFQLKALLMSLADAQSYFVLAMSQNMVRLFRGSAHGLLELKGTAFPEGLEKDTDSSGKSIQSHSGGAGSQIVHAPDSDGKGQIAAFCRRVDHELVSLVGVDDFVILATVDYIASIYREVSSLRGLAVKTISGNPDALTRDQLFEGALPIAREHFDISRVDAERRFFDCLGKGKALDQPAATIQAAREGRIDTLFVPVGVHVWGQINSDGEISFSEQQGPQDQDLLNVALIDTWKAGGRVLAMTPEKMPGGRQVAAITRY